MKKIIILIIILIIVGFFFFKDNEEQIINNMEEEKPYLLPNVTPISHATFVMEWDDLIIYNDPVGGADKFIGFPTPDLILVSDIHGDHLSTSTLEALISEKTTIVAPQAVVDNFSQDLLAKTIIVSNGEIINQKGFNIEAIPMYNLPESDDNRHVKGRGNGYLLEKDGIRVYIAGDTDDIPEMRALEGINMAFIPMNPPYTMDVETAASAVIDFAPDKVYPYHYRGQDGLSDIGLFERIVTETDPDIDVAVLDWYPEE